MSELDNKREVIISVNIVHKTVLRTRTVCKKKLKIVHEYEDEDPIFRRLGWICLS